MAKLQLNKLLRTKQGYALLIVVIVVIAALTVVITLLAEKKPQAKNIKQVNLTGIIDEAFSTANVESAQVAQQQEVDTLKKQIAKLTLTIEDTNANNAKQFQKLSEQFTAQMRSQMQAFAKETALAAKVQKAAIAEQQLWHNPPPRAAFPNFSAANKPTINFVSFNYPGKYRNKPRINADNYVPSNTSVRAVVLGGADADASITGEESTNGAMLFKLLDDGTLPNGQRSHLKGCRVSAHSFGDISSERAIAFLYRLSCAHPGQDIIDKPIHGWVFYNGKVGIKGEPVMRDSKVMLAAGVGGMLSAVGQIAQAAQSIQTNVGLGISSSVPPANVLPFTAYGGAAKGSQTLAQSFLKRLDQYHPVIQVGAGNIVTIVFKEGFYLHGVEDKQKPKQQAQKQSSYQSYNSDFRTNNQMEPPLMNFTVPNEVLNNIDRTNATSRDRQP